MPWTIPKRAARTRTVANTSQMAYPSSSIIAVRPADIAITEPTDRSNSPAVMSSVIP
jgi:hypothetical protein